MVKHSWEPVHVYHPCIVAIAYCTVVKDVMEVAKAYLTSYCQVKSSQGKLYCAISGNYAHNESTQKYKQDINRKTNYISMEIVPLWKFALWILIACGTKEERYRPVTADGRRMRSDLEINWPARRLCNGWLASSITLVSFVISRSA